MPVETIAHGTRLTRNPVGTNPDELGTLDFWSEPIHQMYAQHPFPDYQKNRAIIVWHMDHAELDRLTAQRIYNNQDYDPGTPGCQTASGLQAPDPPAGRGIEMGVFPTPWQADYSGSSRAISEQARRDARRAYSHEEGHRFFDKSRVFKNEDDISRLLGANWEALRPHQAAGDSTHEDGAETYYAVLGADECRGHFSDGKPFTPSPQLYSFMRCLYWLSANLKGAWVASLVPQAGCVWFQLWTGWGWEWRSVSAVDWHQEKWNGSAWVRM